MHSQRGRTAQAGVTLLETIVTISIVALIMVAITNSMIIFYRSSNFAIQEATAVASAQHGVDSMVRTIREAAYSSIGAYPIASMATSSFSFYANVDADSGVEEVHYYISATNLYLGVTDPSGDPATYTGSENTTLVSDNVKNANQGVDLFTYYDSNGAKITDMSKIGDVRFVTVNLVTDIDPNRAPTLSTIRSSAALRNLIY